MAGVEVETTMARIRPMWGEISPAPPNMTVDELLHLNERSDDGRSCELMDGMLVREGVDSVSVAHGVLRSRLGGALGVFAKTTGFRNPIVQHALFDLSSAGAGATIALAPGVAILRMTTPLSWATTAKEPPLLAAEVVAPSQMPTDMAVKAQIYLAAGAEEVWVVYATIRSVEVWTAHGMTTLDEDAMLSSPLLPSFSVAVRFLLDV